MFIMTSYHAQVQVQETFKTFQNVSRLGTIGFNKLSRNVRKAPKRILKTSKEKNQELQRLWVKIITNHGLRGFSGLINGLIYIAAAIGALSMLTSEPTAKSNEERTRLFVLSLSRHHIKYVYKIMIAFTPKFGEPLFDSMAASETLPLATVR